MGVLTPTSTLGTSRYLDGYDEPSRFGTYQRVDGTRGWFVWGTTSKDVLWALIAMSADPTVRNKPFRYIPRRKKIDLGEIKKATWWPELTTPIYGDNPNRSGRWIDERDFPYMAYDKPKQVVYLELARKKAPLSDEAIGQKYKLTHDYGDLHKVELLILEAASLLEGLKGFDAAKVAPLETLMLAAQQVEALTDLAAGEALEGDMEY